MQTRVTGLLKTEYPIIQGEWPGWRIIILRQRYQMAEDWE